MPHANHIRTSSCPRPRSQSRRHLGCTHGLSPKHASVRKYSHISTHVLIHAWRTRRTLSSPPPDYKTCSRQQRCRTGETHLNSRPRHPVIDEADIIVAQRCTERRAGSMVPLNTPPPSPHIAPLRASCARPVSPLTRRPSPRHLANPNAQPEADASSPVSRAQALCREVPRP